MRFHRFPLSLALITIFLIVSTFYILELFQFIFGAFTPHEDLLSVLWGTWIIIGLLILYGIVDWYLDVLEVNEKGVTLTLWNGILRTIKQSLEYADIEAMKIHQNLLQKIVTIGSLEIRSANSTLIMKDLIRVKGIYEFIHKKMGEY